MAEAKGAAGEVGAALGDCARLLFQWWHRVRDGTLKRSSLQTYVSSKLRGKVRNLLQEGAAGDDKKVAGMCRAILKLEPALWTFVRVEGVEPTNNNAERAVRHAVIWRKVCFGTQSRRGSDFVERMLTVVATLRSQGRNILDYVTDACSAAFRSQPAQSLIP
jgi:transposase